MSVYREDSSNGRDFTMQFRVMLLLGSSGGVLTPLTFTWHRFSPLAAFTSGVYLLHNGKQ